MQFVPATGGVWHLIDEAAPPDANLIAVLRGPVEVLAVKGLCEAMLRPGGLPAEFSIDYEGRSYRVTPFGDRGGRLSLRIDGIDGSLSRVETEFRWPGG
ncbi:MAG: hypothetical protein ACKODX_03575 [Gemmata sp.]